MLEAIAVIVVLLALTGVLAATVALPIAAIALVLAVVSSVYEVFQVRRVALWTEARGLIGREAIARTPLDPEGIIAIRGERWRAAISEGTALAGERVRIIGLQGRRLKVEKEP